ncbi:tetratricopeptide repeat protein [Longitalea luteola]|uniref:tetratricopeptide repeat protein n=1 Tax=Longitalea luteola TaxID=2812563 RepID=UPI001A958622|nr:hypothetical protein [Longitalea luteola]
MRWFRIQSDRGSIKKMLARGEERGLLAGMHKIRIFYFGFNFLLVSVMACTQSQKRKCGEFNIKYPEVLSKMRTNKDTGVLISALNNLIDKDISCVDAYLTRGDLFYYSDKLEKAKNDFRKAFLLDTANIYALYKLGRLFQEENMYDSSIYFLQLAINKKKRGDL